MTFQGFPEAALDFYDDLEVDNTKAFWEAHKTVYQEAVLAPMKALTEDLEDDFGKAKLFRPYRDVRFAHDKTPYKTQQGAYVGVAEGLGWYVAVSAAGVFVGGGFYNGTPKQVSAMREGIDDHQRGAELERIVADLSKAKFNIGGETLKTAPRGFTVEHPRIELLRHKSLTAGSDYGFGELIQSPKLVSKVRADWNRFRPLIEWFSREFGA